MPNPEEEGAFERGFAVRPGGQSGCARDDDPTRPGASQAEALLMNLVVLLADRAAGASRVWSDTQSKPQRLGWLHELTLRCPKAIGAGHRCELQIYALAMENAGDNESFPNFVDYIHSIILPVGHLPTDHTLTPVLLQRYHR